VSEKLLQRWITLDLGEAIECKVKIWCKEESAEEDNIKSAISILNTRVGLKHETLNKQVAKETSWNITNRLGR
jgi:hypothetical protein